MIVEGRGNLLTADVEAVVNTVNTVGVMGKGIALQFKRAFPDNYHAYRSAVEAGELQLGKMFVFDTGQLGPRRYVINFPTKGHWRAKSRLEDIKLGLVDLVRVVQELEIGSIAVPALGCGSGGLDWNVVRPIIEHALARLPNVRAVVYPPAGAPSAEQMPVATPVPPMTRGRAVLLATIGRYLRQAEALEPRIGVTELEIQKLAYLLQMLGQPLRLRFVRGLYGPYAETLHHVLQALEGHFIIGYGDRTAKVSELRPIRLVVGAPGEAATWLRDHDPEDIGRVERVAEIVEGFETPYSLELLATVHFAAGSPPATNDVEELTERVRTWSGRKARLFTAEHVAVAHRRLTDTELLPV